MMIYNDIQSQQRGASPNQNEALSITYMIEMIEFQSINLVNINYILYVIVKNDPH